MALGQKKKSTFITISKGKLNVWDGNTNTEHEYVSGHLTNIDFNTRPQTANQQYPNHEDIRLHMTDGDDSYIVTCTAKTGAGRGIMKQLPNFDPSVPFEINLSYEAEFKATTVFLSQNGSALKWFWKAADPKEMPPGVKYVDPQTNKEMTQYNDQTEYLKNYVLAHVKPKLSPAPEAESHEEPADEFSGSSKFEDGPPF